MLLQISKYTPKSLRIDDYKLKKSSLVFESTTVEKTKIMESVLLWTKVTFYRAYAGWYTIETFGDPQGHAIIYIPVQKYLLQYSNIYSSTKLIIPVQKYVSQYKYIYPNTTIFISVQKYFSSTKLLFQYENIYPSTKISSHNRNIFS